MLIPCPSETTDILEQEEFSSELSETHSAGSLEFSSDSDDIITDSNLVEAPKAVLSKKNDEKSAHDKDIKQSILNSEEKNLKKENIQQQPQINSNIKNDKNKDEVISKEELLTITHFGAPPRPGTIAEREHQKWLNAVPLKHNPYSAENISKRSSFSKNAILKENISSFEEFERKLSISSDSSEHPLNKVNCGPKSIDSELYKRDYYVNQDHKIINDLYPLQKSTKYQYSPNDDCFEPLSEEALNSFEEKIYVRSGKVFTLENHVRRLEQEIKDPPLSPDMSRLTSTPHNSAQKKIAQDMNGTMHSMKVSNDNQLPPSSNNSNATQLKPDSLQLFPQNKAPGVSNKEEQEKIKKAKPCRKIHSLTARSLSREFRDLAKLNLPKPMNRTVQVPSQNGEEGTSERESLCSPESVQSSYSTGQADNGHGYTSDESNTSTNSVTKNKSRRHISRSILERATYWERRAEQGLLSDASVSEEFPGIDINPE
ncbi:rab effector MyRIP [Caerostris extrusa]|uniref:Rab effector MyRIP n=1 Tax=Caerostris extrusa TaxID=172846 RepID=A0AAV4REN8_CAEEX|nr:rab effector MyRIP [Caerostris extrusa]